MQEFYGKGCELAVFRGMALDCNRSDGEEVVRGRLLSNGWSKGENEGLVSP